MNCARLTVIAGLVLAVLLPSLRSVAVIVKLPLVLKSTAMVCVPETRAVFIGKVAVVSLEVMPTRSVTELTGFHSASTALTVTITSAPANCAVGVPVLPVALPGAAVSPSTSNCSFENAPTLTVTLALVPAVNPEAVAVMVGVPAVLKVRLDNVRVPDTSVMLPVVPPLSSAIVALLSVLVRVTFAVELLTVFQLASTALTMMLLAMAVPAV